MAFKHTAQVYLIYLQWLISSASPVQTQALEICFLPPVRAGHTHTTRIALHLPCFLHSSLLSLAAPAAWRHVTFLLFLCSCDTKQYLHSKTMPNKQEKHSPICMWPRFLCFLQSALIVCLLGFHIKENISLIHWKLFCSLPHRITYLWKHLALQASNSSFFFYVTYN